MRTKNFISWLMSIHKRRMLLWWAINHGKLHISTGRKSSHQWNQGRAAQRVHKQVPAQWRQTKKSWAQSITLWLRNTTASAKIGGASNISKLRAHLLQSPAELCSAAQSLQTFAALAVSVEKVYSLCRPATDLQQPTAAYCSPLQPIAAYCSLLSLL